MLLRLLGEAQEGKGNLALIDGVAGVGKTRVAAGMARRSFTPRRSDALGRLL